MYKPSVFAEELVKMPSWFTKSCMYLIFKVFKVFTVKMDATKSNGE